MALIKCQECGKEISDKANVCPNCGYKKPLNPLTKLDKIFIPIIAIAIVGGLIGICLTPQMVKRTYPNAKLETYGQDPFIMVDGKMTPNPNYRIHANLGDAKTDYTKSIIVGTLSVLIPTASIISYVKLKKKESKKI